MISNPLGPGLFLLVLATLAPSTAPAHGDCWSSPDDDLKSTEVAADKVNGTVKRLEIRVGDKDSLAAGSKALAGVLEKRGIKHEVHISCGGHTWSNWRHYLGEFAPKLFR